MKLKRKAPTKADAILAVVPTLVRLLEQLSPNARGIALGCTAAILQANGGVDLTWIPRRAKVRVVDPETVRLPKAG